MMGLEYQDFLYFRLMKYTRSNLFEDGDVLGFFKLENDLKNVSNDDIRAALHL